MQCNSTSLRDKLPLFDLVGTIIHGSKKVNLICTELRRKTLLPRSISDENRQILNTILDLFSEYDINDIPHFIGECHRSFKETVFNSKYQIKNMHW